MPSLYLHLLVLALTNSNRRPPWVVLHLQVAVVEYQLSGLLLLQFLPLLISQHYRVTKIHLILPFDYYGLVPIPLLKVVLQLPRQVELFLRIHHARNVPIHRLPNPIVQILLRNGVVIDSYQPLLLLRQSDIGYGGIDQRRG